MSNAELQYFTHEVDGALYGAWYRIPTPDQIEVIGVGMLEVCQFGGFSPESAARSILENFVRDSIRIGIPMPPLEPEPTTTHDETRARDDAQREDEEEKPRGRVRAR